MPAAGDEGLDRTHTWGRTYWGGAMYCLLADVEIRERTHDKRGLIDALRGILAASGGIQSEWPLDRALKAGDEAVGVPVLENLYARISVTPMSPDLAALWSRLGIEQKGDDVTLNDSASEAAIRRAITTSPANDTR
jgi:predicted metalloprotease with PDZ domain